MISILYNGIITTTTITGITGGVYYGSILAYQNICPLKNLTITESLGEAFCFGAIISSCTLGGAFTGLMYGVISPIAIPTTLYYRQHLWKNIKEPI